MVEPADETDEVNPLDERQARRRPEGDLSMDRVMNDSLEQVLQLLAKEVERLKKALEYYRQSDRPDREDLMRWHVQRIDERQDRMEEIKNLIVARDNSAVH